MVTDAVEPSAVALIKADPWPIAVIKPLEVTVATLVLLLVQFVTMELNGTAEMLAKLASAVPCWEVPPTMVLFATLTLARLRNGPGLVFTVLGPSPSLTAICRGTNGPFHIRNSSMLPLRLASPS